jgi:hypothetical protein
MDDHLNFMSYRIHPEHWVYQYKLYTYNAMTTVSLPTSAITRTTELMVLFSKKAAFNIEEYADAGAVFKRLREVAESKEDSVDVEVFDIKYVVSAITVCSQRTPVEAQNYKPIADLLDILVATIKASESEVVEVKEEETQTEL